MEATAGVEPANGGFADLCLTTWLRRPFRRIGECSEQTLKRQIFDEPRRLTARSPSATMPPLAPDTVV